jgi:hypothetical protein
MNVLVACEESQAVCIEFRKNGHRAFSADLQDCSGWHPEWHIKGDVLPIINGNCTFQTMDTHTHTQVGAWDVLIAHPPCTFLTVTGNSWFNVEKYGYRARKRIKDRADAFQFFMKFIRAECDKIAVENPIGFASSYYVKPSQIIQPYQFGDDARKSTCLWLKNLPKLRPTKVIPYTVIKTGHGTDSPWHAYTWNLPPAERAKARSKTFPGIAKAMADQWGGIVNDQRRQDQTDV